MGVWEQKPLVSGNPLNSTEGDLCCEAFSEESYAVRANFLRVNNHEILALFFSGTQGPRDPRDP